MSIPLQRFRQISFLSACLAVSFSPCRATACGPFFPDEVIPAGDGRVLDLPAGDFEAEMIRLLPTEKSPLHAVETFGKDKFISVFDLSAKVDEADLRTTLQARQMDAAAIDKLVASYADVRAQLTARAEAVEEQKDNGKPIDQLPNMVPPIIPLGLPVEFNDYLRGLVAYHLGDLDTARIAWSDLLKLPATQRQFRSTWATFMLGKSYLAQDPAKAGEWFAKTRDLAAAGFSDSLGLASSSLGWQAKADLSQHQFAAAIDLYLKQLATGDSSAAMSLRDSARAVLATGGDALVDAARDDLCRRVITAYVLCDAGPYRFMSDKEKALIPRWLTAVESNAPQNMPGADRLAWAAYRSGDFISAGKWAARAGANEPMALWVRAKLLLRDGDAKSAVPILAAIVKSFPATDDWQSPQSGEDPLRLTTDGPAPSMLPAVAGDLAMLNLTRGQYVESMDLLLHAEYWMDAAYVAERVLTVDELKAYVDAHYPASAVKPIARPDRSPAMPDGDEQAVPAEIRDLLARRLARVGRWKEAREYFPADVQKLFDDYIAGIRTGADKSRPAADRAAGYLAAAKLAHEHGMDMLGTELDPDFFCYGGSTFGHESHGAFPGDDRKLITAASADEAARFTKNAPDDTRRFHYRYIAADHAWAAAQLMANDTDATAAVLNDAGCWLKDRDPKAADRFYKALVQRCPSTALGKAAAVKHWFPTSS